VLTQARIARLKLNKTVAALAKETGIPERALYRFERGQERLSPKHWQRCCQALGVKPEEIFLPEPFAGWPKPAEG